MSFFALLLPNFAGAQESSTGLNNTDILLISILAVLAVAILVLLVTVYVLMEMQKAMVRTQQKEAEAAGLPFEIEPSWWDRFRAKMWNIAPIEKEEDIMLDHEYDGIRELDNHLPPWWKYMFYLTIVFGAVYVLNYHFFKWTPLQTQEYNNEMAAAALALEARQAALGDQLDETNVEFSDDATVLANGQIIYDANCATCHRADGGGGIGPNFTDNYWLHGNDIKDIFRTVKFGVPQKGMISWQAQLKPAEIRDVSSYIKTMEGNNVEGGKAPQGDLYEQEAVQEIEEEIEADSTQNDTTN